MTDIKIDGKPSAHAADALAPHGASLYATPGSRRIMVAEMKAVERTEPAPEEDKQPSVKLRIVSLEVASSEQEDALRRVLRALNLHRTAYGTLIEDTGEVELASSTIERAAGEMSAIEAARLHVLIDRWAEYGRRVIMNGKATREEIRREFSTVLDALEVGIGQSTLTR